MFYVNGPLTLSAACFLYYKAREKERENKEVETSKIEEGTVVKIAVEEGAAVEVGDLVFVLEAMKMEQPLTAHKAGIISNLTAVIGTTVSSGTNLCDIIDK